MRTPRARLLLTLAALASLLVGYYAGQYWQRQTLADISAVVYPSGRAIDFELHPDLSDATPAWRLFVNVDTSSDDCRRLVRDYAFVRNRLASAPAIQQRLRLALLAYDQPTETQAGALNDDADWIDVIVASPGALDRLAAELGNLPTSTTWCDHHQGNAILVSPQREAWALIPYELPEAMAHNVRTIIEFVE
ncbi:MAG: hypothetical protein KDI88_13490 [Gammaproteobacteria bacterium]|nr:hypothetical protein [Gammaproteobacteria bacterium]